MTRAEVWTLNQFYLNSNWFRISLYIYSCTSFSVLSGTTFQSLQQLAETILEFNIKQT